MFIVLLSRRFGLAIGAYLFVYFASYFLFMYAASRPDSNTEGNLRIGLAAAAAVLAFFLPKPGFKEPN